MADSNLSQDEINALLSDAEGVNDSNDVGGLDDLTDGGQGLSSDETSKLDAIGDAIARAHGSSLSTLTSKEVNITKSSSGTKPLGDAVSAYAGDVVVVSVSYTAPASGNAFFIFKTDDAKTFASMASGSEVTEMDEMANSAVQETINNMVGGADTQLNSDFGIDMTNNAPKISSGTAPDNINMIPDGEYYVYDYDLSAEEDTSFAYSILFTVPLAKAMASSGSSDSDSGIQGGENDLDSLLGGDSDADNSGVDVQDAQFSQLTQTAEPEQSGNMDLLLDVPMGLTVELGRARKTIQEILSLGEGSIIELDKLAGEPVEILVNGKAIARGEVVVIDENFGVRVTDIININKAKLLNNND